jgi:hypothetical protein
LADLHRQESESSKTITTSHWQAKQLYKRVRNLAKDAKGKNSQLEMAKADLGLASLYGKEKRYDSAVFYANEAVQLRQAALGKDDPLVVAAQQELDKLRQTP